MKMMGTTIRMTNGVTKHTTPNAKNAEMKHTVAELSDWPMVLSTLSMSRVNRLMSLPDGCESKNDIGSDDTFLSRRMCILRDARTVPLARLNALRKRNTIDSNAMSE